MERDCENCLYKLADKNDWTCRICFTYAEETGDFIYWRPIKHYEENIQENEE